MPEIPQATLDALLDKVADLQVNLTAVTNHLSQLSTGESSNKRPKVDTLVRPKDEEMKIIHEDDFGFIAELDAPAPSNILLLVFEQFCKLQKPNVSPAYFTLENVPSYEAMVAFLPNRKGKTRPFTLGYMPEELYFIYRKSSDAPTIVKFEPYVSNSVIEFLAPYAAKSIALHVSKDIPKEVHVKRFKMCMLPGYNEYWPEEQHASAKELISNACKVYPDATKQWWKDMFNPMVYFGDEIFAHQHNNIPNVIEQVFDEDIQPAASVIELLKTITPLTDLLTVINIEDPVFRAIAYSNVVVETTNTNSDFKLVVSFFGVKHNGEVQVYDHSNPTHDWRRPMLQVVLGHLLTMCPKNISLNKFFNTFEACLLPLATIVTPRGLVQPQTPITETETRNIIFTLYKLLNHYPAKDPAWAKFFKFKDRFLGNNTTTVFYPWKQDVMKYFVCLHATELGLEWNEGYDYADIQFDIRVKYPNTDVEIRLDHLILSNAKSSAAKPMNKLSKMSCFPTRVEPTDPLIDLKPKVNHTIMFFKNEAGHMNMYRETSEGIYEVIDVLGARLDCTLTYSYPSTVLASIVQGILPKLEEYWKVEDNDDLSHKLEQILLLLKIFAKCTRDGKDTPLLPPVMNNEIRHSFLVVLHKLMLATKDRFEDWQGFLCKLLTANQERTLDGTEYTFVHNDIRFLLLKFVSLYNGEVFKVADVDKLYLSNLKALHSRDNWQTLNQLIQGTFSYSSILSIIVDSFITDNSFDLQVQLQFFKRWINQQPEAAQEHIHIISNRWEYLSLNGLTFALECIPLFAEKTLQHMVQTSKYVGLTTFIVRFTPKDSMEDVRFVNSVRQFFIDMESTDAKRTFVKCMLNLVSKLNDTKDKNAKYIMDLAYAFGHRV